jgi:SpoVK/Ycf46/Vps4 family AAA+-type ATPase
VGWNDDIRKHLGKTTVAKHFGNVMKNLELLPRADVVCVTGQSLQGQFVGSTGPLVTEAMKKAKGGILFIDGNLCCCA